MTKDLEIYETNTSNQCQSERFAEFSVKRLQLSTDHRSEVGFVPCSAHNETARVPRTEPRNFRRKNDPRLYRGASGLRFHCRSRRLASYRCVARDHADGKKLLIVRRLTQAPNN